MGDQDDVDRLVDFELARLRQGPKLLARTHYRVKRILIRSLRICAGGGLAAVALQLGGFASTVSDIPFAALTLRELLQAVAAAIGAVYLAVLAFTTAFGEGPTEARGTESELRDAATRNVMVNLAEQQRIKQLATAESVKRDRWYRHGKFVGMLFDPSLFRQRPWVPVLIVIALYAGIGAMAGVFK